MIKLKNVSKYYYSKGVVATGFSKVNLEFNIGEFIAITGESGSGKTTLLNVISGLDTYEDGEMYINGQETSHFVAKDFENYRRENIGNIYQNFNLINSYTVYQNIALVLILNGVENKDIKSKVDDLIKKVSLEKYRNTKVSKLSGGQKQRVAIARALAKDVPIIIADEPTGNLDKKSAESVIKLLSELSKDKLVIIVTHNYEQVEPYVTRKITMHDGRVLEDTKIKPIERNINYEKSTIKNISLFNRIRLGVRNTFNLIPKFVLLLLVFLFVVAALMGEYAMFKKGEHQSEVSGQNYIFSENDVRRIIIKKEDNSLFSNEDIDKIKKMDNISQVIENDILLDSSYAVTTKDRKLWINPTVYALKNFEGELDYGRMPVNLNEVILQVPKDDYNFNDKREESMKNEYFFLNYYDDQYLNTTPLYIVGIKYTDEDYKYRIYIDDYFIKPLTNKVHKDYSTIQINFMNKNYKTNNYSNVFRLQPNSMVPKGEVYISENLQYLCDKYNCLDKPLTVNVENLYYKDSKTLTVKKTYNQENINKLLYLPNYEKVLYFGEYDEKLYVNEEDFEELFDKGTYQMSVLVKEVEKIKDTEKLLNKEGLKTLVIKNTLSNNGDLAKLLRIFKLIITLVLVITLFFISYFVIKIILKSRNIYYSIIRMLGGTKSVTRQLLMVELMTVSTIAYIVFIILIGLNVNQVINYGILDDIYKYFKINDYIILYLIIVGMAFLSSQRYSRKLFKDSVMTSFREEV